MSRNLPNNDKKNLGVKEQSELGIDVLLKEMVESGYTGRKGKGGFYRINSSSGNNIKESRNLKTGEYYTSTKPRFESIRFAKKGMQKNEFAKKICKKSYVKYARKGI